MLDCCKRKLNVEEFMAISVISISFDSSEESEGTLNLWTSELNSTPIIAPTIQPSPDYTPASPDYSPASDSESDPSENPSSDHIPPLPAISPFLSSDDDTTDSDTLDISPSPTHGTPFTEITASTPRLPIIPRRQVMILSPGQPIPHGRPYHYHLNGPVHMMTARKRVGPLPTHHLAVRHSTNYSSPDSSSEASSDFHSDASSDPSSRYPLSDHSSPDLPSTSTGPSRKRRSLRGLKDSGYQQIFFGVLEVDPREISLRDDAIVRVNALRDRGIDARVVVKAIDREEIKTGARGPVEVKLRGLPSRDARDIHPSMSHRSEEAVEVTQLRKFKKQGHRMVGVESAVIALTERIAELERDNRGLEAP
ncbi:hypothetical protein Tco_0626725 [Tanacetum coccineum]|uniref:Uncharacterized protein n=1 Tax=Tanacetum coccineum TaxID=301880 RepID=A0ABQ4WKP6_9ASTR